MIIEKSQEFSVEQAITASGLTASTNVVDLMSARDLGDGTPIVVHFHVTQTFVANTGTKIELGVASSVTEAFATWLGLGLHVPLGSITVPTAGLVLNEHFYVRINNGPLASLAALSPPAQRYLGVYYDADGSFTAGKITANIVPSNGTYAYTYPKSFTS